MTNDKRNAILDGMTDEAVPAALAAVKVTTGITPSQEDGEALSDWLQSRFLRRVEDALDDDPTIDLDEHLLGTPWDIWRREVANQLGATPAEVSRMPRAYEAFNSGDTPNDYATDQL